MKYYRIGDFNIEYHFLYPETEKYFASGEVDSEEIEGTLPAVTVQTSLRMLDRYFDYLGITNRNLSKGEFEVLSTETSTALLPCGGCLIHSVGMDYRGKGILFTGPSGIGKTTQYAQWKRSFGEEVKIISGDQPFVGRRKDGQFWVMPSFWNGKENLHGQRKAPLTGIVILEQSKENSILRLEPADSILPLYSQMCLNRETPEQVRLSLSLLDGILRSTPVWKLSSRGDLNSARLCHDAIEGELHG